MQEALGQWLGGKKITPVGSIAVADLFFLFIC